MELLEIMCVDCKFWDPRSNYKLSRTCTNKQMQSHQRTSYQQDDIETDADFGCKYFEKK